MNGKKKSKTTKATVSPRKFTKVYMDVLDSPLSANEKLVYIALKSFVTYGEDEGSVFPSMATLCAKSSLSEPTVRSAIDALVANGLVKRKRRGLNKTNLYFVMDFAPRSGDTKPDSYPTDDAFEDPTESFDRQVHDATPSESETFQSDPVPTELPAEETVREMDRAVHEAAMPSEEYSMDYLKRIYEYGLIPEKAGTSDMMDVDVIMDLIHETVNSDKPSYRINSSNVPANAVKASLLKLDCETIGYVISSFSGITEKRVRNVRAYLLTMLYNARNQQHYDYMNKINYDLYGSNAYSNQPSERNKNDWQF